MPTNQKVEYYTTEHDGMVQVYSKVDTDFGGPAHNFVAEKANAEDAEKLISSLKKLSNKA